MKRALLWAFVFVMIVVPAASGVCGLGCDIDQLSDSARAAGVHKAAASGATPECPLHARRALDGPGATAPVSPAPGRCGHDHSIARNGVIRSGADLSRPILSVLALAERPAAETVRTAPSRSHHGVFSVPPFSPSIQSLVLRI
ncbi:MAG TPA: hypothetical protein VGG73_21060 [Vicinamibacterales bacterium]